MSKRWLQREGAPVRLTNTFETGETDIDGDPKERTETVYTVAQILEPNSASTDRSPFGESVESDAEIRLHTDLIDWRTVIRDRADREDEHDGTIEATTIARLSTDPFDADGNRLTDANDDEIPDDVIDEYDVIRAVPEMNDGILLAQVELA